MTKKTYPADVHNEIVQISTALATLVKSTSTSVRSIAQFAGISVNSVKSVLSGKTANIATYALIAKALGTSLTAIIQSMVVTGSTTVNV